MLGHKRRPASLAAGTDCINAESICKAGQSTSTRVTAGVLAAGHLIFTVLTLWYLRRALNALQSRSHSENRCLVLQYGVSL
jgi:hypothetical protein